MGLLASIKAAARRDATAFVEEFGEALDPARTDWGCEAFDPSEHGLVSQQARIREDPAEGHYHALRIGRLRTSYETLVARYTREMAASTKLAVIAVDT